MVVVRQTLLNVALRSTLVAGAAAAVALLTRGNVEDALAARAGPLVHALAAVAHRLPTPHVAQLSFSLLPAPPIDRPSASEVPSIAARGPIPKSKSHLARASSSAPTAPPHVTRQEVEEAIENRLGGARCKLARDDSGAPIGLAVYSVGRLSRFGVREGDLLVAANGLPLRTPNEALAALASLKDAHRVTVTMRHGDAPYTIAVDILDP